MAQGLVKRDVATTTGQAGAKLGAPGGGMFATYGIQVKGTGGTPTSWSITLDGSLDGVNWTTIITHNSTDGSTSWDTAGKPCNFVRVNVASLTLGPASDVVITAVAVP